MGTPRDERYARARDRVASRRERRRVGDDEMMPRCHASSTGQRKTRAKHRISDETGSRFFDWKKSYVYGTKKLLFSKKMKISWVGIWCRVEGGTRAETRRRGDETADGDRSVRRSVRAPSGRDRSIDRFFLCASRARERWRVTDV